MPFTETRVVTQFCTNQTLGIGGSVTSAEIDIGDNTTAIQIGIFIEADWSIAGAPAGNERVIVTITPRHTAGGANYVDQAPAMIFQADLGQLYLWPRKVGQLERFCVITIENDTATATDANTVQGRIEWIAVTH